MKEAYVDIAKPEPQEMHCKIDAAKNAVIPVLKRSRSQMRQLTESLGTIYYLASQLKAEIAAHPDDPENKELIQRYNECVGLLKTAGYESFDETFEQLDLIQEKLDIPQAATTQRREDVPILQIKDLPELAPPKPPAVQPAAAAPARAPRATTTTIDQVD